MMGTIPQRPKEFNVPRLQGKVALVTGAASGIGAGIARAFVDEGAFVVLSDLRDEPGRELAKSLGASAMYCHLDVRSESDWVAVTQSILDQRGALDVLVNNAGITGFEGPFVPHDPENTSLEAWHEVLATNLDGTFLGCKYAIRVMRREALARSSIFRRAPGWSGYQALRPMPPVRPLCETTPRQ